MDNMSILASILLILFTLEIIFIFIYMPSTIQYSDSDNNEKSVGPPQFPPPVPPIYTNVGNYEFDSDFGGPEQRHEQRHGRRHGRHFDDDDDDDQNDDKKLMRIHFFIVKNMKTDKRDSEVTITPKFDHNNPKQLYKLKIDEDQNLDSLLIADYHDSHVKVQYKILGDGKVIPNGKGNGKGGTIKLGKIGDLKKYTNLEFIIKQL